MICLIWVVQCRCRVCLMVVVSWVLSLLIISGISGCVIIFYMVGVVFSLCLYSVFNVCCMCDCNVFRVCVLVRLVLCVVIRLCILVQCMCLCWWNRLVSDLIMNRCLEFFLLILLVSFGQKILILLVFSFSIGFLCFMCVVRCLVVMVLFLFDIFCMQCVFGRKGFER